MTREALTAWILGRVADLSRVPVAQIDPGSPLQDLGLESIDIIGLSGELEELLQRPIDPSLAYEHPTIGGLAAVLSAPASVALQQRPARGDVDEPIAVVGMACRVPGARSPSELWRRLLEGHDAISEVPPDRWAADALFDSDPLAPGKMNTRWGGFLQDVHGFDHAFFRIPLREAEAMDPQQRLLLEIAWEGLEDARIPPSTLARRDAGVFIGISGSDFQRLQLADPERLTGVMGVGAALSIAANRLSYALDARGPSLAVDTACSSSLVAIHLAVQSLRRDECDLAIAGGVNVILSPEPNIVFSKARMMAPDGRCKTFDARADGYVRGEGAGLVVLMRMGRAQAEGRRTHAVIRGSATNQDGRSNGLSAPNPAAQEAVLSAAYRDAGLSPQTVGYVEAHGTGTKIGDHIEANALGRIVGQARGFDQPPCWVGSIKSNIGHLESAAGVAGFIKAAMVAKTGVIPPSLHFDSPNPLIDFDGLNLRVPKAPERLAAPYRAAVSGFGFGGSNCHIVLERPPPVLPGDLRGGPHLVALSATASDGLHDLRAAWARRLAAASEPPSLEDLAGAAARGRDHHARRLAIVCRDVADLAAQLTAPRGEEAAEAVQAGKLAFVYPGQGGQFERMGLQLAARFPGLAEDLQASDELLRDRLGGSLLDILGDGPGEGRLRETRISQPAIVALQIGVTNLLGQIGVTPDCTVGHSLGEIGAAYAAGSLSREEALEIACERGRLMGEPRTRGAMLAARLGAPALERLLAELPGVEIAAENSPLETVLSGGEPEIQRAETLLAARGIAARRLDVDYAFHSEKVAVAAETLARRLADRTFGAPCRPMFSSVRAGHSPEAPPDVGHWSRGVRERVRFWDALGAVADFGVTTFVEIGPGATLTPALRQLPAVKAGAAALAAALPKDTEVAGFLGAVGRLYERGDVLAWEVLYPRPPGEADLPAYPWRRTARLDRPADPPRRPAATVVHRSGWTLTAILPGTAPVQAWTHDLSPIASPWVLEHALAGQPVLPATATLGLFSAAVAASRLPADRFDVRLLHPLALSRTADTHLLITRTSGPQPSFELLAQDASTGSWTSCATAEMGEPTAAVAGTRADPPALVRERCGVSLAPTHLYRRLAGLGLDYGPTFRVITDVLHSDDEVWVALSTRPDHVDPAAGPAILLDGGLQAIAAVLGPRSTEPGTWAPSHATGVRLWSDDRPSQATVRVLAFDEASGTARAAVAFWSDADLPVGEIEAVSLFRRRDARPTSPVPAGPLWLYDESWDVAPTPPAGPSRARRWLILAGDGSPGSGLAAALRALGDQVDIGAAHAPGDTPYDGVVWTWPGARAADGEPDIADGLAALAGVARDLAFSARAETPRLWLVTAGTQDATGAEGSIDPSQAAAWGLSFGIAFEWPALRHSRIDLDRAPAADALALAAALIRSDPAGDQFAVRGAEVLARRIAPAAPLADAPYRPRPDGAYLVSGGLGALGLGLAQRLATAGAGALLLVGRRPPSAEAQAIVDGIVDAGCKVQVICADVADPAALRQGLDALPPGFPPIRGVAHLAGVAQDGPLATLDADQLAQAIRPKWDGARALDQLTRDQPLDFFALFSSAASSLGTLGQGAYAAANACLDAFAGDLARRGRPGLAIAWGPWAAAGMAADALDRGRAAAIAGVTMIDPRDGEDIFMRLVGQRSGRVLVLPFDLASVAHVYPGGGGLELFKRIPGFETADLCGARGPDRFAPRPALQTPYVEPRTELEGIIAGVWRQALGLSKVGVRDKFFELGGDSVFASQVLQQINKAIGVRLELEAAFEAFTIEALAALAEAEILDRIEGLAEDTVERALEEERLP